MRGLKTKAELLHEVRLSRVNGRSTEWEWRVRGNIAKNRTAARARTACKSRAFSSPLSPSLPPPFCSDYHGESREPTALVIRRWSAAAKNRVVRSKGIHWS